MGASDFDDSFGDDFDDAELDELDDVLNRRSAVNRQVSETLISRPLQVQRTLTGEVLEGEATRYEEIQRDVTFKPTHHKMDREALRSYVYPENFEVRDYQYDIIAKALFRNLLCAIPTGMGKTFVASTVMLNYYRWFTKGKIIFMAPTRPLVAQQIQACLGVTDIPSGDTAVLLDKSRKNRPEIWSSKRVFFATPQVVENDLKSGTLDPKEIVCLVIDEAHRARKSYAYTNVVKFVERFNTSFRVLALTATPASDIEGVQEVVDNLDISTIEIRTEESPDIVKYMKKKETTRVTLGMNTEMDEVLELLCNAIEPILKLANEAQIYDVTEPSRINAFQVLQKSQALIMNPSIPEGLKWKNYFILQIIGYVGQMFRRLKIYGLRTFYNYFLNKRKEFQTKYELGKSTNTTAKSFFYNPILKQIDAIVEPLMEDKAYVSHPKLEHLLTELEFFVESNPKSRVIIFTELRESALEIVKTIDRNLGDSCKSHIFIGQARAKEGFDDVDYKIKNTKKGRGKAAREERLDKELAILEEKEEKKRQEAEKRQASRTFTSEEAQLQGMNQKQQKELIKKFKKGEFQVLVATSIGEEGLDIGEVDMIICYDTTSSPIKNIQRMGRTGRKNDGKVILLLASNEESKFDKAMEEYANVQNQITHGALDMHESDRIIPADVKPACEMKFIEIPEDNLIIARGEDEDEVIKHATQAMLGQNVGGKKGKKDKVIGARKVGKKGSNALASITTPVPKKRFFMPDDVETGFVTSSTLVRKVSGSSKKSDDSDDRRKPRKNVSIVLSSESDEDEDKDEEEKENDEVSGERARSTANTSPNTSGLLRSILSSNMKLNTPSKSPRPPAGITSSKSKLSSHEPSPYSSSVTKRSGSVEVVALDDDDFETIDEPNQAADPFEKQTADTGAKLLHHTTPTIAHDAFEDDDDNDDEILLLLDNHPKPGPTSGHDDFDDNDDDDEADDEIFPLLDQKKKNRTANSPREQAPDFLHDSHPSPQISRKNDPILDDMSFSKAFEDEEEEEIPGSDYDVPNSDDHDSRIFQDTINSIRKARENESLVLPKSTSETGNVLPPNSQEHERGSLASGLLTFQAFEDVDEDGFASLRPLQDAAEMMEKQYQEDPSFAEGTLESSDVGITRKRESREGLAGAQKRQKKPKKNKDKNDDLPKVVLRGGAVKKSFTSSAKSTTNGGGFDITRLLKERKPKLLSSSYRKTDLTNVKPSQIIDLESQNTQSGLVKPPPPAVVYMSQRDALVPNEFDDDEGFFTEKERKQFYVEYFTGEPVGVYADPRVSARLNLFGKVGHATHTKRFASFLTLATQRGRKRLNKMIAEYVEKSEKPYNASVKASDIIVEENEIEYVNRPNVVEVEMLDDEDDQAMEVNTDGFLEHGPGDEFPSTVSLLSDDDDMFNDL